MDIEEYRELEKEEMKKRNNDHNNCTEGVRQAIDEADRNRYANRLGENWASIMSGLGDQ